MKRIPRDLYDFQGSTMETYWKEPTDFVRTLTSTSDTNASHIGGESGVRIVDIGDILEGGCHIDEREDNSDIDDTDWEWMYSNDEESGLSSSDEDPFDQVMKQERMGRLRLYGRGVCATNLKRNNVDKPHALAPEFIDAIRAGLGEEMQKDFDAHKEKMDFELKAEKDKVANMQKELDSQKAKLEAQKAELDAQKAKVDHLLVQLQKMITGITPENIAEAVTL